MNAFAILVTLLMYHYDSPCTSDEPKLMTNCMEITTEFEVRGNKAFEECYEAIKEICDPGPDEYEYQVDPDSLTPASLVERKNAGRI